MNDKFWVKIVGERNVVVTNDRNIIGYFYALLTSHVHGASRHFIIGANQPGKGNIPLQKLTHGFSAAGLLEITLDDQLFVDFQAKLAHGGFVTRQASE